MAITFQCSDCKKSYRVRTDFAGKQIRCKSCGTALRIPDVPGPETDEGFLASLGAMVEMESQADVDQGSEATELPPRTKSANASQRSRKGKSSKRRSKTTLKAASRQKVAQGLAWLLAGFGVQIASMVVTPFSDIGLYMAGAAVGLMAFGLYLCSFVAAESGARVLLLLAIGVYVFSAFAIAITLLADNPLAIAGMSLLYYLLFVGGVFVCTKALHRMAGYFKSPEAEMHAEWVLHWGASLFVLGVFPSQLGGVFGANAAGVASVLVVLATPVVWCIILARFVDLIGSLRNTLVPDDRPY